MEECAHTLVTHSAIQSEQALTREQVIPQPLLKASACLVCASELREYTKMEISPQDAFDILFYENVSRRDRKDTATLELLAGLYSKYGMIKQSLRIDRRLARLLPEDPRVRYNLACSLSLMGRKKHAVQTLREAIELGYEDWAWLSQDPDLEPLRGYAAFDEIISNNRW